MYDFYLRMNEEFKKYLSRSDFLGKAKEDLIQIMENSEAMKNSQIQESLKKLTAKFDYFVSMFLDNCTATLRLVRHEDQIHDDPELQESPKKQQRNTQAPFKMGSHSYSGLSLKVNFGGESHLNMSELSGGQKSIISLSLMFALNTLTPSKIFLLDEVDSALDRQYREGLTKVVQQLSDKDKIQFFITTFK